MSSENTTHDNTGAVMKKFTSIGVAKIADPRQPVFAIDHDIQNTSPDNLAKYAKEQRPSPARIVELMIEIADAREAQRSYEANLKMFDQTRQMSRSLLELLRR